MTLNLSCLDLAGKTAVVTGGANEHILNIKDRSIDQIMQVNISANVELVRAFLPGMQ